MIPRLAIIMILCSGFPGADLGLFVVDSRSQTRTSPGGVHADGAIENERKKTWIFDILSSTPFSTWCVPYTLPGPRPKESHYHYSPTANAQMHW